MTWDALAFYVKAGFCIKWESVVQECLEKGALHDIKYLLLCFSSVGLCCFSEALFFGKLSENKKHVSCLSMSYGFYMAMHFQGQLIRVPADKVCARFSQKKIDYLEFQLVNCA